MAKFKILAYLGITSTGIALVDAIPVPGILEPKIIGPVPSSRFPRPPLAPSTITCLTVDQI